MALSRQTRQYIALGVAQVAALALLAWFAERQVALGPTDRLGWRPFSWPLSTDRVPAGRAYSGEDHDVYVWLTLNSLGASGDVLAAGGDGLSPSTAERFDAGSLEFDAPVPMTSRRAFHAAEALEGEGRVLIAGGLGPADFALTTAEIYDAEEDAFSVLDDEMTAPRVFATATAVRSGEPREWRSDWDAALRA